MAKFSPSNYTKMMQQDPIFLTGLKSFSIQMERISILALDLAKVDYLYFTTSISSIQPEYDTWMQICQMEHQPGLHSKCFHSNIIFQYNIPSMSSMRAYALQAKKVQPVFIIDLKLSYPTNFIT